MSEDLLPAPNEASDRDRQRLAQVRRNVRIRRAYDELMGEHGRAEALRRLADRFCLQPRTVRAIVYEQR